MSTTAQLERESCWASDRRSRPWGSRRARSFYPCSSPWCVCGKYHTATRVRGENSARLKIEFLPEIFLGLLDALYRGLHYLLIFMVGLVCLCESGSGGISSPDKSADCTLVRLRSAASLAILHTPSCADTPIQPAPTRQGTSSTKTSTVHVRPNIRYPQTAYPRTLVLCWTVGSRSEMSFSRTGRTTHRWRTEQSG